jgi:hypothetical protein
MPFPLQIPAFGQVSFLNNVIPGMQPSMFFGLECLVGPSGGVGRFRKWKMSCSPHCIHYVDWAMCHKYICVCVCVCVCVSPSMARLTGGVRTGAVEILEWLVQSRVEWQAPEWSVRRRGGGRLGFPGPKYPQLVRRDITRKWGCGMDAGVAEWERKWTKMGGGGVGGLSNVTIRWAAMNYTSHAVVAVFIPRLGAVKNCDYCFLTLWRREFVEHAPCSKVLASDTWLFQRMY